jgi:hypothetical protein
MIEPLLMGMFAGIKASGLPQKVGLFSGQFFVRINGDNFTKQSKPTKYTRDGEYVATWRDIITLYGLQMTCRIVLMEHFSDAMESSRIEVEVFARRCFFSYKIIKKTESNQSLGDLLGNANNGQPERLPLKQKNARLTDIDSGRT